MAQGWKPGAISKGLLKKLNKAKQQTQQLLRKKPPKKTNKKKVEDKPTLIICKRNGEYHVEMQASPEDSNANVDQTQCGPLVYRISREDNEERIQKRLRKRQRIVKKAIDKVWADPYHPEACKQTCLRAYNEAMGLSDLTNTEYTCSEEDENGVCSYCGDEEDDDDSSDASSLDLEWEIHFSPPIAAQA